jgi:hypothetical protein
MAEAAAAAAANQRAGLIAKSPETYKLKLNYQSWLKQFRNYTELLNVPANNIYRTFLSFLDEETFGIVEALNLDNARRADFYDNETQVVIRDAIKNRQGERIPAEYMLRFRKQREGESIEKYAAELEKMALEAFPDEQDIRANRQLIQSFLMGVRNDELGVKLLEETFDSLTDAVNAAARHCKALQTRRYIRKETEGQVLEKVYHTTCQNCTSTGTSNATNEHTVNATNEGQGQQVIKQPVINAGKEVPNQYWNAGHHIQSPLTVNQFQHQGGYNRMQHPNQFNNPIHYQYRGSSQQRYPYRQNTDKRGIQCYNCHKYGHYKYECWALKNGQGSNQQAAPRSKHYCSYCSKRGHSVQTCWHLNKTESGGAIVQTPNENLAQNTNPFRA